MKILTVISLAAMLALAGCGTSNPNVGPMTHAAFTTAVTLGEQFALEQHPEATPYLRAATPVVCSVANGTNFSPSAVVSALEAAGVTNSTTKMILNGSLALLDVVIAGLNANNSSNYATIKLYGQDLCNGLQAGLPPEGRTMKLGQLKAAHLR